MMNPNEEEIKSILKRADEIIFESSRAMLVKVLKGQKKKLLERELERQLDSVYFERYMLSTFNNVKPLALILMLMVLLLIGTYKDCLIS